MEDLSGVSKWLRESNDVPNTITYRAVDLVGKRNRKEVDRLRAEGQRKNYAVTWSRTSIAQMAGRGEVKGLVTECGRFLEVWQSFEPQYMGMIGEIISEVNRNYAKETEDSIARRVNARARKQIRRLVNSNDFRDMVTLTIAPPSPANDRMYLTVDYDLQRNYKYVRKLFKSYIQRARRRGWAGGYVAVFELHDSERTSPEKRGCWHIHYACDFDEPASDVLDRVWWHGMVNVSDYRYDTNGKPRDEEVVNPGAYMAEYIGKEGAQFGNAELLHCKRYSASRNVKRPKKVRIEDADIADGEDGTIIYYKGKRYKMTYSCVQVVPNTDRMGCNAVYQLVEGEKNE